MYKIPFFKPYFGGNEKSYIDDVLSRQMLNGNNFVSLFEKSFAQYVGVKYAIAVSNGTSGLHLLTKYIASKKSGSIVTTPLTFIASANAILYENQGIIFTDIGEDLLIDEIGLETLLIARNDVTAVVYVDLFGNIPKNRKIREICDRYGVFLIEDASQSLGSRNDFLNAGQLGHAAVFSFNKNKQITSGGEGGMIVTDNEDIYQFCLSMRDQGRFVGLNWLDNAEVGYNYRMTEVQAAIGFAQLERADEYIRKRNDLVNMYHDRLKDLENITLASGIGDDHKSWFIFYILVNDAAVRNKIISKLGDSGIECKINYFPPVYKFKAYRNSGFHSDIAEKFYQSVLALPLYFEMTDQDVDLITNIIKECYGQS